MRLDPPEQDTSRPRLWPAASVAAAAGAVAGATLVLLLRRWWGQDAEDAQEPGELQAVVDRPELRERRPGRPDVADGPTT